MLVPERGELLFELVRGAGHGGDRAEVVTRFACQLIDEVDQIEGHERFDSLFGS